MPANFFMAYFPSPNFDTRFSVSAAESSTRRGNCSRLENYEKTTSWRRRRNLCTRGSQTSLRGIGRREGVGATWVTDLIENRKKRDFIRLVKWKNCRLICRDYKMAIMRSALNLCVATSCKLEESLGEAPILTPIENLIYIADLDVARVRGKDISRAS